MPKLFISMIGLTKYTPTCYQMPENEGGLEENSAYQQTLLKKALKPDITWLVGTKEAKNEHSQNIEHDKFITIPKGSKAEEFWDIFKRISAELDEMRSCNEAVKICLDLTHGFRTQPIFVLSAVRYYCRLYDDMFSISDVYYAMFEKGNKKNSILNATPILEMENIAGEVRAFLEHGSSRSLADRLKKLEDKYIKEIRDGIDRENPDIKGKELSIIFAKRKKNHPILQYLYIKNDLVKFGDLIGLNYTPGAADCISRLCKLSLKASESLDGEMAPIAKAFSKLNEELNQYFPDKDRPLWKWHAAIALWCLKRNFLQQALTHANELLITRYCEETGFDPLNSNDRKKLPEQVLTSKGNPREGLCDIWKEVVELDLLLGNERNYVNHAFCRNSNIKIDEFSKKTREKVESLLNFHMNLEKLPGLIS